MKNSQQLYKALYTSFVADKEEAKTTLQIFSETPVGVAEHTSFVKDMREQVKKIAEAEESIQALESIKEIFGVK